MDVPIFQYRPTGQNRQCPQVLVSFKLASSLDHSIVIEDCTEAEGKQVLFPDVIQDMTANQKEFLFDRIAETLLQMWIRKNGD